MKNILLAVVGMSPQVITETLYALHQQKRNIDAIHVITTRKGREAIELQLLSPNNGQYFNYLADYGIDRSSIAFGFDNIHTVTDQSGAEIDDIAGEEENEYLLKKCLELTFHFTNDPDNAVFFSIAGGRKTMSACLIAAAQLYGRPQDRIYHVLIAPEYESSRDFFYPPRQSVAIELRGQDGQPYFKETRYALVNLVPLPFVSVREQISNDLLSKPQDPATLMLSLIKEESYTLTVDLSAKKIIYKNMELDMMPTHLSLYAFFVMQKKNCNFEINSCRACHKCFLDFQGIAGKQEQITALYIKAKDGADIEEMSNTGITRLTAENFNSYKTKIKTELTRGFGLRALAELAIESVGSKPDTGYGIALDREKIRVVF